MIDDLKHALKRLRARRSTTLIAVTTLALAIGISVAMFTVVDALIFRPAPFKNPESFVWLTVGASDSESRSVNLSIPLIKALRAENIGTSVHFIPIYRHPFFAPYLRAGQSFPVSDDYYARCISLPIFPDMTDLDVRDVADAVTRIAEHFRAD